MEHQNKSRVDANIATPMYLCEQANNESKTYNALLGRHDGEAVQLNRANNDLLGSPASLEQRAKLLSMRIQPFVSRSRGLGSPKCRGLTNMPWGCFVFLPSAPRHKTSNCYHLPRLGHCPTHAGAKHRCIDCQAWYGRQRVEPSRLPKIRITPWKTKKSGNLGKCDVLALPYAFLLESI